MTTSIFSSLNEDKPKGSSSENVQKEVSGEYCKPAIIRNDFYFTIYLRWTGLRPLISWPSFIYTWFFFYYNFMYMANTGLWRDIFWQWGSHEPRKNIVNAIKSWFTVYFTVWRCYRWNSLFTFMNLYLVHFNQFLLIWYLIYSGFDRENNITENVIK